MIKVVMKDVEDLLINGNDINKIGDDYHINKVDSNGFTKMARTVAIIKAKDVVMVYEVPEDKVVE